ncbi:MAG: aminomethyl transferase family protein, partial [Deltaproteobacteria bacterium]
MLETALHTHLAARGATHADDRGVVLPRHFGDAAAEYRALREGVALIDLGFRTVVRASGADRATFLQGMLSNDVAALRPGEGCPALLLTIQGRVVADVRVAATDE